MLLECIGVAAQEEGLATVLTATEAEFSLPDACGAFCVAISRLCATQGDARRQWGARAVPLALRVLEAHPDHVTQAEAAVCCVWAVVKEEATCRPLVARGSDALLQCGR